MEHGKPTTVKIYNLKVLTPQSTNGGDDLRIPVKRITDLYGRLPDCKDRFRCDGAGRLQLCIRPVRAEVSGHRSKCGNSSLSEAPGACPKDAGHAARGAPPDPHSPPPPAAGPTGRATPPAGPRFRRGRSQRFRPSIPCRSCRVSAIDLQSPCRSRSRSASAPPSPAKWQGRRKSRRVTIGQHGVSSPGCRAARGRKPEHRALPPRKRRGSAANSTEAQCRTRLSYRAIRSSPTVAVTATDTSNVRGRVCTCSHPSRLTHLQPSQGQGRDRQARRDPRAASLLRHQAPRGGGRAARHSAPARAQLHPLDHALPASRPRHDERHPVSPGPAAVSA